MAMASPTPDSCSLRLQTLKMQHCKASLVPIATVRTDYAVCNSRSPSAEPLLLVSDRHGPMSIQVLRSTLAAHSRRRGPFKRPSHSTDSRCPSARQERDLQRQTDPRLTFNRLPSSGSLVYLSRLVFSLQSPVSSPQSPTDSPSPTNMLPIPANRAWPEAALLVLGCLIAMTAGVEPSAPLNGVETSDIRHQITLATWQPGQPSRHSYASQTISPSEPGCCATRRCPLPCTKYFMTIQHTIHHHRIVVPS